MLQDWIPDMLQDWIPDMPQDWSRHASRLVPACLKTGPEIDLKNLISNYMVFRGGYTGIRSFDIERSKDWIRAPS